MANILQTFANILQTFCCLQIPDDPLTIINDDEDVEEFDDLEDECTRVVGYFDPGSKALKEFEEAAEEYMGEIEFFAVVHEKVSS